MRSLHKAVAFLAGFAVLATAGIVLAGQAGAAVLGDVPRPVGTGGRRAANPFPVWDPRRLTHVGDAGQLIVVAGDSATSSYSTLRTYEKAANGLWVPKFAAMPARNGYAGWARASQRIQDTGTTPWGTFTVTDAFGLKANPGTRIPYRAADSNDYWVGDAQDPQTYNLVQPSAPATRTWRTSEAEKLSGYPVQYEYAAVIDFNRPDPASVTWNATLGENVTSRPADVAIGSAIFLHINGAGSTAGCVSLARADLLSVLRWLDPARRPRIVMAPLADLPQA
jgi:L,D-peptidoglycan transpeptidase YkuD (ErfK/YbiS/YcfS/YnhG family)